VKTFRNSAIAGTAAEASLVAVHGSRLLTVRDELELKVPSPKGGDGFMSLLTPRRERGFSTFALLSFQRPSRPVTGHEKGLRSAGGPREEIRRI
jgi:hypothetical protein